MRATPRDPFRVIIDDESQPQALRVAAMAMRTIPLLMSQVSASIRGHGGDVHPSQFRLLIDLARNRMSPSEIATKLEVSLPTVSKTLSVLEHRGWVERAPDPSDRRRVTITLTGEGRRALHDSFHHALDQLGGAFERADPDDLDTIERGLAALARVLEHARETRGGAAARHPYVSRCDPNEE